MQAGKVRLGRTLTLRRGVRLLALVACGAGCIDDFDHPEGYGLNGSDARCRSICDESKRCPDSELTGKDCTEYCQEVAIVVEHAGCRELFDDFVGCLSGTDVCQIADECERETNDFAKCYAVYCEDHAAECAAPNE